VLREERAVGQLDEVGGADQRRGERHGGNDEGAACREPALGPLDRREASGTLGHARDQGIAYIDGSRESLLTAESRAACAPLTRED
jgi:hypothetical protein